MCSGKESKEYKCINCGFDQRTDFVGYRTIGLVSMEDVETRKKYAAYAVVEKEYVGGTYIGYMKNDQKNGYGTFRYRGGDRYEGQWKDDKKNGKGTCCYINGDCYKGEWKNDRREGFGVCYYANGDCYEGEWKNNEKNGSGKYYHKDGFRYKGEWKNDVLLEYTSIRV